MVIRIHWDFTINAFHNTWKIIFVSHTGPLFHSTKANYFIGQLWQLLTASNVGARTRGMLGQVGGFQTPGVCLQAFPSFLPHSSPLFYLHQFLRSLLLSFSFFAPKPQGNACYAGYTFLWCSLLHVCCTRWFVLTFDSVNEILKCDHAIESYGAVLSCGTFIMLYKVVLTLESVDEILKCHHSN